MSKEGGGEGKFTKYYIYIISICNQKYKRMIKDYLNFISDLYPNLAKSSYG
jgi:hypothetical protein